jgi:antitoxin (DNA-binding transcriptional repressor) of toxin-antitoxin stability system
MREAHMSLTVSIEQTAAKLAELIAMLKPDDEIVLTDHNQPVARLLSIQPKASRRRVGGFKGILIIQQEK